MIGVYFPCDNETVDVDLDDVELSFPTIRNSLKKQKSMYKVLTPSIKVPI